MAAGGMDVSEKAMDNAWVDFGPDNRKRGDSEEEKGGKLNSHSKEFRTKI